MTVAAIARERDVPYLVDASQTAGARPLDFDDLGIDLLACTGHKSLLGPTGTGALVVRKGLSPLPLMHLGDRLRSAFLVPAERTCSQIARRASVDQLQLVEAPFGPHRRGPALTGRPPDSSYAPQLIGR